MTSVAIMERESAPIELKDKITGLETPQEMRGAQILLEALLREGVDTIFGYPGGAVLHIYDELAKQQHRLRHILRAP